MSDVCIKKLIVFPFTFLVALVLRGLLLTILALRTVGTTTWHLWMLCLTFKHLEQQTPWSFRFLRTFYNRSLVLTFFGLSAFLLNIGGKTCRCSASDQLDASSIGWINSSDASIIACFYKLIIHLINWI